jgi:hypothetical protein
VSEVLHEAARYLRILHAVERAHSLGSEDELISLLSGVDPFDLHECATVVQGLAVALPPAGGEPQAASVAPPPSDVPVASANPLRPSPPAHLLPFCSDNEGPLRPGERMVGRIRRYSSNWLNPDEGAVA